MQKRCLILSCSQTKVSQPDLLPAVDRYDGPIYHVLRKYLREAPLQSPLLDIFILSAEFGLISANKRIPVYERQMTASRAAQLRTQVMETIRQNILSAQYSEIFVSMGQTYLLALDKLPELVGEDTQLITSNNSSGKMLSELKKWLWNASCQSEEPEDVTPVSPNTLPQTVVLRGNSVTLTTAETIERLQSKIVQEPQAARRVRKWYVDITGEQISPKWAAQTLFDLPVSKFSADEARRVLRGLGLSCYQR